MSRMAHRGRRTVNSMKVVSSPSLLATNASLPPSTSTSVWPLPSGRPETKTGLALRFSIQSEHVVPVDWIVEWDARDPPEGSGVSSESLTRQCVLEMNDSQEGSACRSLSKKAIWCWRPTSTGASTGSAITRCSMGSAVGSAPMALTQSRTAAGTPSLDCAHSGGACGACGGCCGWGAPPAPSCKAAAAVEHSPLALTCARLRHTTEKTSVCRGSVPGATANPTRMRSSRGTVSPGASGLSSTNRALAESLVSVSASARDSRARTSCVREMRASCSLLGTRNSNRSGWCCLPTAARQPGPAPGGGKVTGNTNERPSAGRSVRSTPSAHMQSSSISASW
mmetsp:Transcript_104630/g.296086  ORF Transcript_104630/g.296086 Transcript_104630/m.296086 type:complete len:338 (+) Transcript_104630:107-1120(+)